MGICGCRKEADDLKETNLGGNRIEKNDQIKDDCFDNIFEEQLFSMKGEYFNSSIEEIIPQKIKKIRNEDPFNFSKDDQYKSIHNQNEIKFKTGILYKGSWNNKLQMEGRGLLFLINDQVLLEGYWKEGNFEFGRIYLPDGSYYEGEINGTVLNGQGKYLSSNGEKYEGSFVNGYREGQGRNLFSDDCVYIGEFKQDTMSGNGLLKWSDGTSYQGEIMNNIIQGKGELTTSSGSKYIGEFKNNWPDGEGEYIWSNGADYIGHYERGKKEGKGVYKTEKIEIQGIWCDGALQGKCAITHNNKTYSALYRNGRLFEMKESANVKDIEFLNLLSIQIEDYNPTKMSHLTILDDSKQNIYLPDQGHFLGSKTLNDYFVSSRESFGNLNKCD